MAINLDGCWFGYKIFKDLTYLTVSFITIPTYAFTRLIQMNNFCIVFCFKRLVFFFWNKFLNLFILGRWEWTFSVLMSLVLCKFCKKKKKTYNVICYVHERCNAVTPHTKLPKRVIINSLANLESNPNPYGINPTLGIPSNGFHQRSYPQKTFHIIVLRESKFSIRGREDISCIYIFKNLIA